MADPMTYRFPTLYEAEHYIAARTDERTQTRLAIHALKRRFDAAFPQRPSARLVLRRGGGICWRLRGSSPNEQPVFDMTGELGRTLLQRLSPAARASFLEFEEERSALDMRWRILNTEVRCLQNWAARKRRLRALRKSLTTNP